MNMRREAGEEHQEPELGFDPDVALQAARGASNPTAAPAPIEEGEDGLFAITADLTLARANAEPDLDGVIAPSPNDIVVAPDDTRRETPDDPRIPPSKLFFKIGEVSRITGLKPYVLRYWETEFPWIRPSKTSSRQRLYRRQDIAVLLEIKRLRYEEQRTIADTKACIREERGLERARRPSKPPRRPSSLSPPPPSMPPMAVLASDAPPPPPRILGPILRDLRREVLDLLAFVDGEPPTHAPRAS